MTDLPKYYHKTTPREPFFLPLDSINEDPKERGTVKYFIKFTKPILSISDLIKEGEIYNYCDDYKLGKLTFKGFRTLLLP